MFSIIKTTKGHVKDKYCFSRNYYLADYRTDVSNLPTSTTDGTQEDTKHNVNRICDVGSVCKVCEDGSVWILNNQDEWVEQPINSSSGNSGSSGDTVIEITADDITEMWGDE